MFWEGRVAMKSAPSMARLSSRRRRVILTAAFSLLFIAIVEPTYAQGSTTIAVDLGPVLRTAEAASQHQESLIWNGSTSSLELDPGALVNAGEIAMIAQISKQIEAARNPIGAKLYAKDLVLNTYNWSEKQYSCLNSLWNKESHWNYKARNPRSGAHGIAQALPATKMESISTDWRTNPLTQIQWGLSYIESRYQTPCKAYAKWKRSRYY